ncbi:hypothetical protein GT030_05950 [Streptomyces sp. SID1328]|uniref:SLAC1 family transporter n=1 Tax=Streptomyces sp. SID1328 TaxID=2690250 RepID=UPI00136E841C|nr:hypothetical protein [Streptomyces sp. SID1328]MYV38422.1 hypothetical protein [Streptomyces sp. SID1328]
MSGTSGLRTWVAERPPAAGTAVMATAIVSIGLRLADVEVVSRIFLVLACLAWLTLAVTFALRLAGHPERWAEEARDPAALTAVAATAVLGTRISLLGVQPLAGALLALAALFWPVLLVSVLRHWGRRMPGTVFMCCVATQALAVLAATLAGAETTAWLGHAALVLFWLGLLLYALTLPRFDSRQVLHGPGDHWIAGGALSISALAGARLISADSTRLYLWNQDDSEVLHQVTAILLVLDLVCYAVLVLAELARPRPRYVLLRWATVFSMGMTAAATLAVSAALDVSWLSGPGKVLVWVAVAVWLAAALGAMLAVRAGGHGPWGAGAPGVTSTARR